MPLTDFILNANHFLGDAKLEQVVKICSNFNKSGKLQIVKNRFCGRL